jgi:hypothetical protein
MHFAIGLVIVLLVLVMLVLLVLLTRTMMVEVKVIVTDPHLEIGIGRFEGSGVRSYRVRCKCTSFI